MKEVCDLSVEFNHAEAVVLQAEIQMGQNLAVAGGVKAAIKLQVEVEDYDDDRKENTLQELFENKEDERHWLSEKAREQEEKRAHKREKGQGYGREHKSEMDGHLQRAHAILKQNALEQGRQQESEKPKERGEEEREHECKQDPAGNRGKWSPDHLSTPSTPFQCALSLPPLSPPTPSALFLLSTTSTLPPLSPSNLSLSLSFDQADWSFDADPNTHTNMTLVRKRDTQAYTQMHECLGEECVGKNDAREQGEIYAVVEDEAEANAEVAVLKEERSKRQQEVVMVDAKRSFTCTAEGIAIMQSDCADFVQDGQCVIHPTAEMKESEQLVASWKTRVTLCTSDQDTSPETSVMSTVLHDEDDVAVNITDSAQEPMESQNIHIDSAEGTCDAGCAMQEDANSVFASVMRSEEDLTEEDQLQENMQHLAARLEKQEASKSATMEKMKDIEEIDEEEIAGFKAEHDVVEHINVAKVPVFTNRSTQEGEKGQSKDSLDMMESVNASMQVVKMTRISGSNFISEEKDEDAFTFEVKDLRSNSKLYIPAVAAACQIHQLGFTSIAASATSTAATSHPCALGAPSPVLFPAQVATEQLEAAEQSSGEHNMQGTASKPSSDIQLLRKSLPAVFLLFAAATDYATETLESANNRSNSSNMSGNADVVSSVDVEMAPPVFTTPRNGMYACMYACVYVCRCMYVYTFTHK